MGVLMCTEGPGRQEALLPTSMTTARAKHCHLVPGGACLLESMAGLRTRRPAHQLLYRSKQNRMVGDTPVDRGSKPPTWVLTSNSGLL